MGDFKIRTTFIIIISLCCFFFCACTDPSSKVNVVDEGSDTVNISGNAEDLRMRMDTTLAQFLTSHDMFTDGIRKITYNSYAIPQIYNGETEKGHETCVHNPGFNRIHTWQFNDTCITLAGAYGMAEDKETLFLITDSLFAFFPIPKNDISPRRNKRDLKKLLKFLENTIDIPTYNPAPKPTNNNVSTTYLPEKEKISRPEEPEERAERRAKRLRDIHYYKKERSHGCIILHGYGEVGEDIYIPYAPENADKCLDDSLYSLLPPFLFPEWVEPYIRDIYVDGQLTWKRKDDYLTCLSYWMW